MSTPQDTPTLPAAKTSDTPKKGLFVKTYGCQMNVYDSQRMTDVLAPLGYAPVDTPEAADIVILNTCHIREKASEKTFSELGRLRQLKDAKRDAGTPMMVAVAGCVAQAEGDVILQRAPYVDLVVGPQTYHRLPELIAQAARNRDAGHQGPGRGILATDFPVESKFDLLPETTGPQAVTAFLTVQEGCDKFCTFCVVPYTRGAEFSRPIAGIVDEARRLVAGGAREITLLGQNVNAFHGLADDGSVWGLGRLLRELAEIEGLARLRYTTSHPLDVDDDLIAAHRELPQVMPFLHLPVQSGSDRILAAMNRRHTADDYRRIVARLKDAQPDLALSSDFIVGYPGETDQEFQSTLDLIAEIGFASSYAFKFSARPGTPAAGLPDTVEERVKDARLAALLDLVNGQIATFNRSQIGRVLPVLFEKPGRFPGQLVGRTPFLQPVHIDVGTAGGIAPGTPDLTGSSLVGQILQVRIDDAHAFSLSGTVISGGAEPMQIALSASRIPSRSSAQPGPVVAPAGVGA